MRRLPLFLFAFSTLTFLVLTIRRSMLDYNENGVYFDGAVTYDRDAVVTFGTITVALALVTIVLAVRGRRS